MGAIVPDLPIFIFYFVAKFMHKLPEREIWSQAYYQPFWQNIVSLFHSFPMALIALIICLCFKWQLGAIACASILLHCLFDLPLHNYDAHRHFFPFSSYRFISPVSYWDPQHYGKVAAFAELTLVLLVTPMVFQLLRSWPTKGLLIILDLVSIIFYCRFYLFSSLSLGDS
ncbi:MAG: hypothetical protein F6K24_55160 [Okeania sp. SIO2D1]|nr:hypothetical protein [Okeania sp. SIO2D1]